MIRGQAFLNVPDKTARGNIRHLNVIITEPDSENNVLVVPVCTYREKDGKPLPWQDPSCRLPAGCHPFVNDKSFVGYNNARVMSLIDIINGFNKGILVRQKEFEAKYVQDIQRGAEESLFLPEKFKRFFEFFL